MDLPFHRITHRRPPLVWQEGFALGNGRLGVMLWGNGDPLCLTLDHCDLWDLRADESYLEHPDYNFAGLRRLVAEGRFDEAYQLFEGREKQFNPLGPTKISIGRAELQVGKADEYECSLQIERAHVVGRLRTVERELSLTAFVHRDRDLFCLQLRPTLLSGDPRSPTGVSGVSASSADLRLLPLSELTPEWSLLGHPPPQFEHDGDLRLMIQQIPEGPAYAVAWNTSGEERYIAVGLDKQGCLSDAAEAARAAVREALRLGFDQLHAEHVRGWEDFWSGSAVFLPEARLETLWYMGVYLLASCARKGSYPPGLQGVWAMDGVFPPWRGDYHADMNVQEQFWPACCSGHLELLDAWCDHMRSELPLAQAFCRRFFDTEGAFWPATFLPRLTSVPCWYTVEYAWSSVGWLAWLSWLRWRYSMDTDWLAQTGYPVISEVFRFYRANLVEGEDGFLHVPLSSSPEYRDNRPGACCSDPNIDLALIRRCCDWVVEMEQALSWGRQSYLPEDSLTPSALDLRSRLVPYSLTESGALCLSPGKPLDESHRHPSHLMAIHPAMDLTVEGDDDARRIIAASLDQFVALGQFMWAGHTYAQLISLAAVIGQAGLAYDCLRQLSDHWIGPNGLHFNADLALSGMSVFRYPPGVYGPFTFEANCGLAAGIGDMLVQGWGDRLRIFPAVPDKWEELAFRDLLTEGAFRVSAIRRARRTVWVQIRATVDRRLRLRDAFEGAPVEVAGPAMRREGDDYLADLKAGETIILSLPDAPTDWPSAVAAIRTCDVAHLGL